MRRIGERAPRFRVPALMEGAFIYIDSARFQGRWMVLCCLPSLGLVEPTFLDQQVEAFAQKGASLLAVGPEDDSLHQPWASRIGKLRVPILADPLRRLRRSYGIARAYAPGRCRTFLMDPDGLLQFHLVHDLNGREMSALLEIIGAGQSQKAQRSTASPQRSSELSPEAHISVFEPQFSAPRGEC